MFEYGDKIMFKDLPNSELNYTTGIVVGHHSHEYYYVSCDNLPSKNCPWKVIMMSKHCMYFIHDSNTQ